MGNEPADDLKPRNGPPLFFARALQRFLPKAIRDPVLGDLFEDYETRRSIHGERVAAWRYRREAVLAIAYGFLMASTIDAQEWKEMSMSQRNGLVHKAMTSVGVLIASWLLLFVCARIFSELSGREAIQALATAAALILAVSLRVRLVAFFLAAMLSFNLAELVIHSIWGPAVVRGAQTHFAVMGAGILGVVLGLVVNRFLSGSKEIVHPDQPYGARKALS